MIPRPHAPRVAVVALTAVVVGLAAGVVPVAPPFADATIFALCVGFSAVAAQLESLGRAGRSRMATRTVQAVTLAALGGWAACAVAVAAGAVEVLAARRSDRAGTARHALLSSTAMAVAGTAMAWVQPALVSASFASEVAVLPAILVYGLLLEGVGGALDGRPAVSHALITGVAVHLAAASVAVFVVAGVHEHRWMFGALVLLPTWMALRAWYEQQEGEATPTADHACLVSLDLAVCTLRHDGRVALANPSFLALVGRPESTVVGHPLADSLGPSWLEALQEPLVEARRSGRRTVVPLPVATDGPTATRLEAVIAPTGPHVTLSLREATPERQASANAVRDDDRITLLSEGAHDGLWEWDLSTRTIYFSERWKSMTGLPAGGTNRVEDWLHRVHPDDLVSLTEAIEKHLAGRTGHLECEHRIRRDDGTYRWFLCRGKASGERGQRLRRLAGSLTDISDRVDAQERVGTAALRDPLTGLQNRTVFVDRLGQLLRDFKAKRHSRFAILYLDLDRFKLVNDSLGHLVGDELLIAVSRRLESCLRHGDSLARLGGDEFVILLDRLGDENQANAIALRLQGALAEPFSIGGREVFSSASIGIALSLVEYETPDDMMRAADMAMYHAKARGKARHETFDADMHARALDRLHLENALRRAVANQEIEVHFQPIVSLSSRHCVGFESLVRWSRDGKPVSPSLFIPVAEELGLIETIGTRVLQEACQRFAQWRTRYPESRLEYITVNVSPRQLMQPTFPRLVEQAVRESGLRPEDVRLEITETALMDAPQNVAALLGELRRFGAKVYLDDFGTGYSSLSHLHRLPVDALKIDRSFVMSLLLSDRPAIVESILALAKTLNTGVVAEGVESHSQALELLRLGCQYAQGFYFSRPIPASAVDALLAANQPLGDRPPAPPMRIHEGLQPVAAARV